MYVPGVASVGILSLPVVLSTVRPVRPPLLGIVIATSARVTGFPFRVSLPNTSTIPPLATEVSGSSTASILRIGVGDVTVILTFAISQTVGFALSQIL